MIEAKFEMIKDLDDPERCQGVLQNGQCQFKAEEGQRLCPRCQGGSRSIRAQKELKNYRLTRFKAKVEEKSSSDAIKSLNEEIGILRLLLEETLNRCKSEMDLILSSNKISELAVKIERLVASAHKLELATGELLNKTTVITLAENVIQIIIDEIPEGNLQEKIANRIAECIN